MKQIGFFNVIQMNTSITLNMLLPKESTFLWIQRLLNKGSLGIASGENNTALIRIFEC